MRKKQNKKKWVAAATSLAAIAALAATFAWFTSNDQAKNHFEGGAAGNDVEIVETFTPPTDWKPGQEVNKDVSILNTGDYDAMVRVSLEEAMSKLNNATPKLSSDDSILTDETKVSLVKLNASSTATGSWTDATFAGTAPTMTAFGETFTLKAKESTDGTTYKYVSYWDNGTTQYYAKVGGYTRDASGAITPTGTPEFKYVDLTSTDTAYNWQTGASTPATPTITTPTVTVDGSGKATVIAGLDSKIELNFVNLASSPTQGKWYFNTEDNYFYYIGKVSPQEQTPQLLDSVKLNKDADNTYSKFSFDLIVNATSIQAEKEVLGSQSWDANNNTALYNAVVALYPAS